MLRMPVPSCCLGRSLLVAEMAERLGKCLDKERPHDRLAHEEDLVRGKEPHKAKANPECDAHADPAIRSVTHEGVGFLLPEKSHSSDRKRRQLDNDKDEQADEDRADDKAKEETYGQGCRDCNLKKK